MTEFRELRDALNNASTIEAVEKIRSEVLRLEMTAITRSNIEVESVLRELRDKAQKKTNKFLKELAQKS